MTLAALQGEDLQIAAVLVLDALTEALWVREDGAPWLREASAPWRRHLVAAIINRIEDVEGPVLRLMGRILGFSLRGDREDYAVALVNLMASSSGAELAGLLPAVGAAQVAAPAVVQRLVMALDNDDDDVLVEACRGAGYLVDGYWADPTLLEGWPELFDALMACVQVGEPQVSRSAAQALWRLSRQRVPSDE